MENKECCNEKRRCRCGFWKCVGWGLLGIVGFGLFAFVFGAAIMWLWNCLVPSLFHLPIISFWQAVGLAVLARLLFGGMGHRWHHKGMGRWGRHRHGHCGCHSDKNSECGCGSGQNKWHLYDKYWEEEGEKSFSDYVKRKTEGTEGN